MLALIGGCYLAWDILGHAMARRTDEEGRLRYPQITADRIRTMMAAGLVAGATVALGWTHLSGFTSRQLLVLQGLPIVSVVAYRTAKDQLRRPAEGNDSSSPMVSTFAEDGGATGSPATSGR